jgi:hypothetical protein
VPPPSGRKRGNLNSVFASCFPAAPDPACLLAGAVLSRRNKPINKACEQLDWNGRSYYSTPGPRESVAGGVTRR